MDKGIRQYARHYFVEQNELRRRGEAPYVGPKANTIFRRAVVDKLLEEFNTTMNGACTHYNDALHFVRDLNAELVSGLGRPPEKNNGGRKKKVVGEVLVEEVDTTEGDAMCAAGGLAESPSLLLGWAGVVGEGEEAAF